jgi:hypothetical protein
VFAVGHIVSGHTLKHVIAAGAVACLVAMLRARRQRPRVGERNASIVPDHA